MRITTLLSSALLGFTSLCAGADSSQPDSSDKLLAQATALAQSALIADTHIDVPIRLHEGWSDVTQATQDGEFDYPRAVQGGLNLSFMSIYTPAELEAKGGSYQLANALIDSMEALVGRAPGKFAIVRNPAEARAAKVAGKMGIALGMENGSPIIASLADVADHIDHVVQLSGIEHVGIGSDFDCVGDSLPVGLKDVSTYPALIAELLRRGYNEEQLIAILGGNLMRVWTQVERYAASQQE